MRLSHFLEALLLLGRPKLLAEKRAANRAFP